MCMYGKTKPANMILAMDPALKHKELEVDCVCVCVCWPALTGKPCVMGSSILKRRIRALNRVQTLIGSLGSQNTQPTLEGSKSYAKVVKHTQSKDGIRFTIKNVWS